MKDNDSTMKPSQEEASQLQPHQNSGSSSVPLVLRAVIVIIVAAWAYGTNLYPTFLNFIYAPLLLMVPLSFFKLLKSAYKFYFKKQALLSGQLAGAVMWIVLLFVLQGSDRYKANKMKDRLVPLHAALNKYKSDNGRYPETLNLLQPGYLEDIPGCYLYSKNEPRYFLVTDSRDAQKRLGKNQYLLLAIDHVGGDIVTIHTDQKISSGQPPLLLNKLFLNSTLWFCHWPLYFVRFIGAVFMGGQTENVIQRVLYPVIYGLKGELLGVISSSEPLRVIPLLLEVAGGVYGSFLLIRRHCGEQAGKKENGGRS